MTLEQEQQEQQEHRQIIKTREDPKPIILDRLDDAASVSFKPIKEGDAPCSWAKDDQAIGPEQLRPRIEPWLTALVQSEHLSLLIGSGLTRAVHQLATDKELSWMETARFEGFADEINTESERTAKAAGRESANFEDQLRVANELLRGLQIIACSKPEDAPEHGHIMGLQQELIKALKSFANSILEAERDLAGSDTKRETAFNYLVSFLMSLASRSGTRDRLHIFTTNYDRCIEAGADIAGLRLIDRFVGTLMPVFRASRLDVDLHYNPPGIRGEPRYLEGVARFTKLHGSVDWIDCHRAIRRFGLPFGAENITPYLQAPGLGGADAMRLMIYPNAAKDRETAEYPYVELFRDFAASICRPNSTLVTYGYSFGDEHVNRVIEDMLTIPSAHLVIISFSDPQRRIMSLYDRLGRPAQITLLIGDHLGDLRALVDHYLPKPAIDRTTLRMAELLNKRFGAQPSQSQDCGTTDTGGQSL